MNEKEDGRENQSSYIHQKLKEETKVFQRAFAKETLQLMTSGFGLVAALAWNSFIQEVISTYIQPFLGESSGVFSQLIYALFVTALAVFVTYHLSKIAEKKS